MLNYRQLIPILVSLSLTGCITYSGDGYYSSPGITEYNSDEYYGDYDNYNGNYGQYEYYGNQPSVVFNFNMGYGYGSGYGYGYGSGYGYGYGYPSFYFPIYAYYPNYYGWGYWPVYDYRPHHHHHKPKPPRDHHNPPNDNDDHDDQDNNDSVVIGDDYPINNGTRPNKRPGKLGQFPNQIRTPGIYNGNVVMPNIRPRDTQPVPVRRPTVIDSPVVVDDNDYVRPPRNYSQQPNPVRTAPVRPRNPMQIDENGEIVADQYHVRTYNAQQPNLRNRANPTQANQVQNSRRPQNADRNSYAQPLRAEIEPSPSNNNNGPAPQPQPRQPRVEKSERRESKKSNDDDD